MSENVVKTLRDLLVAQINAGAITKDLGGATTFNIIFELPALTILRDFIVDQNFDLIITVGRTLVVPKRFIQGVPLIYDGRYPVQTWCIDKKPEITGVKLKSKADFEIERIFEDNPGAFSQSTLEATDDDHKVGSQMIYNTRFIIQHKRYNS